MKKASKILLVIEAVLIAFLAIEGAMITLGVVISLAIGQGRFIFAESIAATVMFCALISGCRIFGWVITNGPSKGIYIYPAGGFSQDLVPPLRLCRNLMAFSNSWDFPQNVQVLCHWLNLEHFSLSHLCI